MESGFRIEQFGSSYYDADETTLFTRDETKELLTKHELWITFNKDTEKFWKGEAEALLLENLRSPWSIEIEYTYKCNLQCKYCYAYSSPHRKEIMPFEKFKRIIHLIDEADVLDVYVFGGEPCILPNYLKYLLNNLHKKYIIIASNCTLITDDICRAVKESSNHVEFSVQMDGYTKELHNATRGNFDLTIQGLNKLKDYAIPIRVSSCITPHNYDKTEELVKFLTPYNILSLKFSPVGITHLPNETAYEFDMSENFQEMMEILLRLRKQYRDVLNIGIAFDIKFEKTLEASLEEKDITIHGPCVAGILKCAIDVEGLLVPCISARPKIRIPLNQSLEYSFNILKKELIKANRKTIEFDGKIRSQQCCELFGYGHEIISC